ncbi:MAG: RelA/SpoT domain-containing protein [Gallionella sp.]|nr:RelA/SpoT domain-containing protein [Gallionella sp.]MDP1941732.1 RelA/SpoT domain-containing protein [Gallionella sp.]
MDTDAFRKHLEESKSGFAAWGKYVTEKINEGASQKLGEEGIAMCFKIPSIPRLKKIDSALGKIGRKGYDNPIAQMTDLVGVRYVVLLSEQIDFVCDILKSEPTWLAEVSKDYQQEIETNPKIFDYQSQHFEVRPKNNFEINGILITTDMCCEVQIRTLLQHAYAELVHDSIYKPVGQVPYKAERQVAKSMALMETTDELFCSTMKLLTDVNKPRNQLYEDLTSIYREKIGGHHLRPDVKTSYAVLDEFRELFKDGLSAEIGRYIEGKQYIAKKVVDRAKTNLFFAQPIISFVYWAVDEIDPDELKRRWPLPGYLRDIEVIFSDLDRKPSY